MGHVKIDVSAKGRLHRQIGSGPDSYHFYVGKRGQRGFGLRRQRGRGLGSLFRRAWQMFYPIAKKYGVPLVADAAKAVAVEGASTGSKILNDIAQGKNLEQAVHDEGVQAVKRLAKKAGTRLQQMGSGKPRRTVKNLHVVGRSVLASTAKRRNQGKSFSPY
jgi:hypothetical protein